MAFTLIKRWSTSAVPIAALFGLLLVSLYLMGRATQNSDEFGRLYVLLLLINLFLLMVLVALIVANMLRLWRQYRAQATGSRLTLRLVVMFVVLAMVPVSLVYYFSIDFLRRGIDSWFDVRFDQALNDALELSRTVLDDRMRDLLRRSEKIAKELARADETQLDASLNLLSAENEAGELSLFTLGGRMLAFSGGSSAKALPTYPEEAILLQLRQGVTYMGLDQIPQLGLNMRVVVPLAGGRVLQVLYPVPERLAKLTSNVQSTYARYDRLQYLRDWLKFSFTLTLSLVLLLSLLTAVWTAFYAARRLVAPIRTLAIGTRAVARGDYNRRLPVPSHDEFGVLVQSFNDMTGKIAQAQEQARLSQQQAEGQRAYLEAVLGRLSSGVLVLDAAQALRTINAAACGILGIGTEALLHKPLQVMAEVHPHLHGFVELLSRHVMGGIAEWREEVTIFGVAGRQVLICGGATLAGASAAGTGSVIVIEDVTTLIQAQRDAAWGEMARRLAHEIKNPLTPIRLSAERLRHKYLKGMAPADADVLDRSTHTIMQQVDAMQEMVKAFADYARTPKLQRRALDLNRLIDEVLDLYRGHTAVQWRVELDPRRVDIEADAGRFRQLLHNLIKNALDALADRPDGQIRLVTRHVDQATFPYIELRIEDNGPGFPAKLMGRIFEPYVTTKPKGTGLGLAIVKKIVEEHSGMISAENAVEGACIIIHLPIVIELSDAPLVGGDADDPTPARARDGGVV